MNRCYECESELTLVCQNCNTRATPARCDELETVARVTTVFKGIETFAGDFIRGKLKPGDILVTRQNAEEVIAAKDARIAELEEHFAEMTRSCLAERDRNKALEADNKRLREALETIAYGKFLFPSELRFTARAALGEVKP